MLVPLEKPSRDVQFTTYGESIEYDDPALAKVDKTLRVLQVAKGGIVLPAVDVERALQEAARKFPAPKQKYLKKAAEYMRIISTKKVTEISDLIKMAITEIYKADE